MPAKYHIISDCDGIFTSANIHCTTTGKSGKMFSVNDSLTIDFIQRTYKDLVDITVITGDTGAGLDITMERMRYMSIPVINCKNKNKYSFIKENFDMSEVIYVGDDIFDFAIFRECFLAATVNNAPEIVKKHADIVSQYEGGKNAMTDILFKIMEYLDVDMEADLLKYIHEQPAVLINREVRQLVELSSDPFII